MDSFIYTDFFVVVLVLAFCVSMLYLLALFVGQYIRERRERLAIERYISSLNLEEWDDEDTDSYSDD